MNQSVRLVAYTKPIDELDMDIGEFIAYCARVSNPGNQNNKETSAKLLKYLIKNKHWSPMQMAHATLEVVTTRDIARQMLRHTSFAFQEFSQRYADPTKDMKFVAREARLQDTKNRQNSIDANDKALQDEWVHIQDDLASHALRAYQWAASKGIAKEQARVVLPEGLTVSRLYMAGSIRSFIHYCDLRMKNGTQKEHMEIAQMCWREITTLIPTLQGLIQEEG